MDSWQKFDETSLPDKEAFYSNLNMEYITDGDYRHGKTIFEYLINKNLGNYRDLYVQSDTLLLADVFENFRNMFVKVYELDPAHFLSATGLAWQACLKRTKVKLELLTNVDKLLMVEKGIRRGICHAIYRYAKANNKYKENYNKDKEESFLQYYMVGQCLKKLTVRGILKFNEEFIKNYDEDSDKGYILEVDVKYPKNLHGLHEDLPFLPKRIKIGQCKKLAGNLYDKKTCVLHIRSLKQDLNHGLILKKVYRVIQFYQEAWLKPYIDLNVELRKK